MKKYRTAPYTRGRYKEYKLIKNEEKNGAIFCVRSAKSHSPFDVFCFYPPVGSSYGGYYRKLVLFQIGKGKTKKMKKEIIKRYSGNYDVEVKFLE